MGEFEDSQIRAINERVNNYRKDILDASNKFMAEAEKYINLIHSLEGTVESLLKAREEIVGQLRRTSEMRSRYDG